MMSVGIALLLSMVLPGMGLVFLGWWRTGLVVGVSFSAGVNGATVLWLLAPGAAPGWVPWAAGAVAIGAWLASVGGTAYAAARRLPSRSAEERDALFRDGLAAYLRGDLDAAAGTFRAVLRLHRADVEAHLKLAMVHKARGEWRQAVAELRRCRYYDADDAWRWEVERELADVKSRGQG